MAKELKFKKTDSYSDLQRRLKKATVLVVGDVMLNEHVEGITERMSPESPATPILKTQFTDFTLGGAAQAAANVSSLGAKAILAGVTGKDQNAEIVQGLLKTKKIHAIIIADPSRPTTVKTRIFRGSEHLLRVDTESIEPMTPKLTRDLLKEIKKISERIDFVIISDYAKGVLSPELLDGLKKIFGAEKIIADIKPKHAPFMQGIHLLKPNKHEAETMIRSKIENLDHAHSAAISLAESQDSSVLITLGGEGMVLHDKSIRESTHFPAHPTELIDVTGAGDVVISTLAALLAIELDLKESARLANIAAAIAVAKPGATTVTVQEILDSLDRL